jgi:phytoene dehydrogenase-like protein
MLLALLADGQMGFLEGGCREFVGAIEKRYPELGGEVTYRATVAQILTAPCVESKRNAEKAVGVRLDDGTEHRADVVVSAADGYSTLFAMLDGRYVDDKTAKRYAQWKTFRPLVMISYGMACEFRGEMPFATYVLREPLAIGRQRVDGFFVRIFTYSPRFAPAGKTVVQVGFESEWEYWNDLQREDRRQYDTEKERLAAEVLQRLEAHYPGLSSQVEVTDVATPYTTWRYTLNRHGSWGGWLLTAEAMRTPIQRTLPGLANLILAGQWVMPGGGVPSCLYSGRHAVQLLCRQDGKPFVAAPVGAT